MAASKTPKKSTAKRSTGGRKKTASARTSPKKNTNEKQSISSGFQTEIILLVLMAAAIILMVSCMGLGGSVGGSISKALMGVMGLMAYVFPIALFIMAAFLISNKGNVLAYKKTAAAAVLFFVFCGLLQLFTEGYTEQTTLSEYYRICSEYHTGGGVIGGAICISTISAFGTVGAYVIIALVILVCLILITQHSFLGFLYKIYDQILGIFKGTQMRYQEGEPERQLKKQLKAQQRQQAAKERREKRMQELEAALANDELEEGEGLPDTDRNLDPVAKEQKVSIRKGRRNSGKVRLKKGESQAVREKKVRRRGSSFTGNFLEGTDLFGDREEALEENPLNPDRAVLSEEMAEQVSDLSADEGMEFAIHRPMQVMPEEESVSGNSVSEDSVENVFEKDSSKESSFGSTDLYGMNFGSRENTPEENILTENISTGIVFEESLYNGQEQYNRQLDDHKVNYKNTEEEDSYAGVDFQEAMATVQNMPAAAASGSRILRASGAYSENGSEKETASMTQEEKTSRQPAKNPKSTKKEIESGIVNIQHEINSQEAVKKEYQFPPVSLLKHGNGKSQGDSDAHLRKTAQKLQEILYNFGVNAKVTNVSCGPTVTRYELQPEMGVKVSKIVGLSDDIKLNLAASDIRIEAPIPGKAAVGIEVPNKENSPVMLRDLIQSPEFQNAKSKLAFAAGKDIEGKTVVADIAKMPHLLIAGSTGSGKSVCINTLIISILYKAKPDEVKLIMIDPKVVELSVYNGIPHLFIPVVTDPKKAAGALNWAVTEMSNRYNTFAEYGVRNLDEFNRKIEKMRFPEGEQRPEKMCQIVIIVDELADLMMVAPGDVEDAICRLAQLARAAGIHLVIATQRPSVNVITGLIKANMPSRIAFAVTSGVDSRTILDMNGAEKLLGKGDMLFYPQGYQKPARLQGAFVSDDEVSEIVGFLSDKNPGTSYDNKIEQQMNNAVLTAGGSSGGNERDVYFEQAGKFIIEKEKASIGMLQRMYKIGFNRAARIMDQLCDAGVVGPEEGTKPRKVLMSMEEFQNYVEEHL